MSERTRAKEALRVEVNTYTGENVRKIAATSATAQEDRILRVAAYCRVSMDDIDAGAFDVCLQHDGVIERIRDMVA